MKKYIIWGGTGHAKVIHELLLRQGHSVAAVVDNAKVDPPIKGVPVLYGEQGLRSWLMQNPDVYMGVAAIGTSGKDRLEISDLLCMLGMKTPSLVHEQAFVATTAHVDVATQVLANACVCAQAVIGRGVIINTGSIIEHDTCINEGTHIAPGTTLAGEVHVGRCCFIGAGSTVLPRIHIGNNSIIGAGSVVTRDVGDNVIAYGAPAKVVRALVL